MVSGFWLGLPRSTGPLESAQTEQCKVENQSRPTFVRFFQPRTRSDESRGNASLHEAGERAQESQ